MRPRTLTGGIALLLGASTALLLGAAAVLMDHLVDAQMQRRFDADLLSQARALVSVVQGTPWQAATPAGNPPALRRLLAEAPASYRVRCRDGRQLQSDPAPAGTPAPWTTQHGRQPAFADVGDDPPTQRAVWFDFTATGAATPVRCQLLYLQSRRALDASLDDIDLVLLLTPLLALLLVLALSPLLVRRGLRPLTRLRESMRGISPQLPAQRLPPTGTRELEPLVASFNDVLARMDAVLARERRFAQALAHETRTRLAELRTLTEVERRYPSGRPLAELLGEIGAIGTDMEGTVTGLLLLTRLEAGLESPHWQRLDIGSLLTRQLARLAPQIEARQLRLDGTAPAQALVREADAALLDLVLGNLLGNACEYAPIGSQVRITWHDRGLCLDNPAPELAPAEIALLGQRYWSKQQGRGGHTGLGLALATAAATAMGCHLHFALHEDRLQACLRWPS